MYDKSMRRELSHTNRLFHEKLLLLILSLSFHVSGFNLNRHHNLFPLRKKEMKPRTLLVCRAQELENGDDEDDTGKDNKSSRPKPRRFGGRRKKPLPRSPESPPKKRFPQLGLPIAIVFLCLLLLRGLFFGGSDNTSSYYYYSYESSVYETRAYAPDGQVEVSRKESRNVKSNIPGMENNPDYFIDKNAGPITKDYFIDSEVSEFR